MIPDERDMLDLLTLLLNKMNTIDGQRDTATLMKHNIVRNRSYQYVSLEVNHKEYTKSEIKAL